MLNNLNDSKLDAELLAKFLKNMIFHVNLIPANKLKSSVLNSPPIEKIHIFANWLMNLGINVTVRRTLGSDISASCGQLRANIIGGKNFESNI